MKYKYYVMLAYFLSYGPHMLCKCIYFAVFCVRQYFFCNKAHSHWSFFVSTTSAVGVISCYARTQMYLAYRANKVLPWFDIALY